MRFFYWLIAALSFFGGAAMLVIYFEDPSDDFPAYETLSKVEGEIAWVQKHRYGVRFGFRNDGRGFNYPSKARELGLVRRSLESSSGSKTAVLIDPGRSHSPFYSDEVYFTVFEIRIDDKIVRSYPEISDEWMSDQRLMPYLGGFGLLAGLYIFWFSCKLKKHTETGEETV